MCESPHGMKEKSAFHIAKLKTPKSEVREREQVVLAEMSILIELGTQEEFEEALSLYGIKPGHPRYAAALSAWNSAQALKKLHR